MTDPVKNREHWLQRAAALIRTRYRDEFAEHFGDKGEEHLDKIHVSAGFPSRRGENGKVIGQCWRSTTTEDGSHHIFISPLLKDPIEVLATLAHEMVHAADDGENKHKGPFVKAVRALGLEGKPTATVAGDEFRGFAEDAVEELGEYPHVALKPVLVAKTQKTYMVKCVCPECGCIVRMTQKWMDDAGIPFCGAPHKSEKGNLSRVRMEVEG